MLHVSLQQPVMIEDITIRDALQSAKLELTLVAEDSHLEAEILLAHILKKPRSYLYAWPEESLGHEQTQQLTDCIKRRCQNEPIAYITGSREFWSLDLLVTPDTLIPRPETELLVESILNTFPDDGQPINVADLGTGSGAIGLSLAYERPHWQIYATDISQNALVVAKANAKRLGVKNIHFYQGSWCDALPQSEEAEFDVIVSNPPYVSEAEWESYAEGLKFEPRSALVPSVDGLQAIRIISHSAKLYLKSSAYVLVEHGFLQGALVRKIFAASGYHHIHSVRDLSGHERITVARNCC